MSADEIISQTLAELPAGYIPAHTPETIPARVRDLVKEYAKAHQEREKLWAALDKVVRCYCERRGEGLLELMMRADVLLYATKKE